MPDAKPQPLSHKYAIGESVQYATRGFSPLPAAPTELPTESVRIIEDFTKTLRAQAFVRTAEQPAPPRAERTGPELKLPTEKRAVWIVHGMGQQLPFETLDALASGVLSVCNLVPGHNPRVTAVKFAPSSPSEKEQVVERVELDIEIPHENPQEPSRTFQLHLYEAYWAPLTEGAAKLSDVISFFFTAAIRGFANVFKPFQRAMFPDQNPHDLDAGIQRFYIPPRSAAELVLTLGILLSLIAINSVIVAASAAKAQLPGFTLMSFDQHWPQLTAMATGMSAIALTFGIVLFLGEMCKPAQLPRWKRLLISAIGWIGFSLTAFTILAASALMSSITRFAFVQNFLDPMPFASIQAVSTLFLLAASFVVIIALLSRAAKRSSGVQLRGDPFLVNLFLAAFLLHVALIPALIFVSYHPLPQPTQLPQYVPFFIPWLEKILSNPLWVWPALITLAKFVRELLVQYPGDVAIYVDSNKLDRFDKIRKEIKQVALNSVTGIYTALNSDKTDFEYSKIAIVGHSLGSVVAYDTLNQLLNLDDLAGNPVGVETRTCLLETFGSPLDKIAFFFTIQGKETFHIREQLAAVVQPLIQSYTKFRNFDWVNVYSRNDIVSGELKFYDVPNITGVRRVINLVDKDAVVPLVAHTDYWKNTLVWQELLSRIAP